MAGRLSGLLRPSRVEEPEFLHRLRLAGSRLRKFRHEHDLLDVSQERVESFSDAPLKIQPQAFRKIR
jgi:hypothetical protein